VILTHSVESTFCTVKCNAYRAGGPWLITDMRRGETIFDINPQLQVTVLKVSIVLQVFKKVNAKCLKIKLLATL